MSYAPLLDQVFVHVNDVLEGRALAGCAGMFRANYHLDTFALFHTLDHFKVLFTCLGDMRQEQTDWVKLFSGPSSGVPAKFSFGLVSFTRNSR